MEYNNFFGVPIVGLPSGIVYRDKYAKMFIPIFYYDEYIKESGCIAVDKNIKKLDVKIESYRRLDLSGKLTSHQKTFELPLFERLRTELKLEFNELDCVFEIEKIKLKETANIINENILKSEDDILNTSTKEQYTLFAVGGIIILAGLFIILKK
jgi:hypothetical protein